MTNEMRENEPQSPFFSGWRRVALWLAGAAALAVVGYRGALGTETAAAAPPQIATAPPITGDERPTPAPSAQAPRTPGAQLPLGTPPKEPAASASASPQEGSSAARGKPAEPGAGAPENHVAAASPVAAITPDGRVVLNLATEAELRKLPGIGKSRARAIVEQRERVGRFRRLEDLLRVKGIGPKRLAALRAKIVLDAP